MTRMPLAAVNSPVAFSVLLPAGSYLDDMREALERWAEHLTTVVVPSANARHPPNKIRRYYRKELDAFG